MMNVTSVTNTNLISQFKDIPLILCPNCKTRIPHISVCVLDSQMCVYFKCYCSKQGNTMLLRQFIIEISTIVKNKKTILCSKYPFKEEYYCAKCNLWLCIECLKIHNQYAAKHHLNKQELNVQCNQHQIPYSLYCTKCNINICIECKSNHKNHYCFSFRSINPPKSQFDTFTMIIKRNKEYYTNIIKKLDQEDKTDWLSSLIDDVQSSYIYNQTTNEDLLFLHLSICQTLSTLQLYPSYELIKLQQPIEINVTQYKSNILSFSLINECKTLIQYFKTNFIFKISLCKDNNNDFDIGYGTCIVELRDGRIAFGTTQGLIILWDQTTTKITIILQGHSSSIITLIELSDGKLASTAIDKTIILWNTLTNQKQARFREHKTILISIVELQDGRLASNSEDRTLELWDSITYKCLSTLSYWANKCKLCLLSDGRLVYSIQSHAIILLNTVTNEESELFDHSYNIQNIIELGDGRLASSSNQYIKLWNISTKQCTGLSSRNTDYIIDLVELKDERLAANSSNYALKIWNTIPLEWVTTIRVIPSTHSLVVLNDGRLITQLDFDTTSETKQGLKSISLFTKLAWSFIDLQHCRIYFESEVGL